uniref:Putative salivary mucin n=1 Tax=Anopheles marajoara TaxID=58244 RepID=A0A2M4BRL0_9DIPT
MRTKVGVCFLIASLLFIQHSGPAEAFGWWFLWTASPERTASTTTTQTIAAANTQVAVDQSANGLQIEVGNRENTDSFGNDGGTNITNVEVNYARALLLGGSTSNRTFNSKLFPDNLGDIEGGSRAIPATISPDTWIEGVLDAYYTAANESALSRLDQLTERFQDITGYAQDVEAMLDRIRIAFGIELNRNLLPLEAKVMRCVRNHGLDTLARDVFEGGNDCVRDRLDILREARLQAVQNISGHLVQWGSEEVRDDIENCRENHAAEEDVSDLWTSDGYQLACISQILHRVHQQTLLLSHSADQLTAGANEVFGTGKAQILQCAADLVELSKESLVRISTTISGCQEMVNAREYRNDIENNRKTVLVDSQTVAAIDSS